MSPLLIYRDDGPLARMLGRVPHGFAPSLLAALAVVPLFAAIGAGERSDGAVAAVFGWLVLLGGLSLGGPLDGDRFRWAVPPLLRAGEYAGLIWLAPAGAFPLVLALAFRHYDLVYRLRYQGRTPPEGLGGGWDLRLAGAWVLLVAGALPGGFYALGGILGALFVAECVASWRTFSAAEGPALYDQREGEAE